MNSSQKELSSRSCAITRHALKTIQNLIISVQSLILMSNFHYISLLVIFGAHNSRFQTTPFDKKWKWLKERVSLLDAEVCIYKNVCWPGSDFCQQAYCSHYRTGAISCRWQRRVNGETALLWQKHGLHCLDHLFCDWELIEGESLLRVKERVRFKWMLLIKMRTVLFLTLNVIPQIWVCRGVI